MRKFWNDCKGAVTVLVTLLLIPAVLITGTAVDYSRIFTAKSVMHDANQLAANSVLASYDALLQDLYGLYGVMEDDPVLGSLLNEYIETAILGDQTASSSLSTLRVFDGSDLSGGTVTPAEGKNLNNAEVLRRQIEEYAKFRAPVIIVNEILDKLDAFEKVKHDAEAISLKMTVEKDVEEIQKQYKKLYELIEEVNVGSGLIQQGYTSLNTVMKGLRKDFEELSRLRYDWDTAFSRGASDEELDDISNHFDIVLDNIKNTIDGGKIKSGWIAGGYDENGEWIPGEMQSTMQASSVWDNLKYYTDRLEKLEDKLDDLVDMGETINKKKKELEESLDKLKRKLESGECSESLASGMSETVLNKYEDLLGKDVKAMAEAMRDRDLPALTEAVNLLENPYYETSYSDYGISFDTLTSHSLPEGFSVDYEVTSRTANAGGERRDYLDALLRDTTYLHTAPDYYLFQDSTFSSTGNPAFYQLLKELDGASGKSDEAEEDISNLYDAVTDFMNSTAKGVLLDPEGAYYYKVSTESDVTAEKLDEDAVIDEMNHSMLTQLGTLLSAAGDKILLLTYATEMFSCYTTESGDKAMSGVPMGVEINYFFQSELELLYNGNHNDAKANLSAVRQLLLLVRFVFNYIAAFSIPTVNTLVNSIVATLVPFIGPFAYAVGELSRAAIALAEASIDVAMLRSGQSVALLKGNDNWILGGAGSLKEITASTLQEAAAKGEGNSQNTAPGEFSYLDYVRLFLLFIDGDTLADNVSFLIGVNLTNKKNDIGQLSSREARQQAMSSAEQIRMQQYFTDFSITTTANLRMLFMSMGFAQSAIEGVSPAKKISLEVVDYRGY